MRDRLKILVTGGAGFIGSNFIHHILDNSNNLSIVNLDKLTYAADLSNLESLVTNNNYTFIKGDICDSELMDSLFKDYNFTGVIHFAAESHVDNSIKNPDAFINTNIHGTFNLINTAKNYWMDAPFTFKKGCENNRFHHISTDEVYGTLGQTGLFTEQTPYAPNSPYSASKASSDFIVRSYFHTYGMNVVTTNCSNNYGPKQHKEKLIPTIIRKALSNEDIPIYGDGKNIRDWLYVKDHCKAIDLVFKKGTAGETYNVGGKNERNNLYIADKICAILDNMAPKSKSYKAQITFVSDRPGHDFRYAIDASKIETQLGWRADENFETGIIKTVNWYLKKLQKK
ncbi:dTDP-glucose 4,6-dehydratase [uncultured Winogradskyella sp.]|uniref:dTDP-glucose 4,6-dehydratase n=1 Tax=uncultured Winogradskyella sp. TaxID=395353 RepID=UPI0026310196|nr:dTDP-glucose 4,6-dehydratase [uncultured Winogradskyella sp.]